MNNKIPEEEQKIWAEFLNNPNQYPEQKNNHNINNSSNLLILDLHGKTLKEAEILVKKSIYFAKNNNIKKLEIITGIGKSNQSEFGVLYQETPKILDILKSDKLIKHYQRNKKNRGSIIVKIYLKNNKASNA